MLSLIMAKKGYCRECFYIQGTTKEAWIAERKIERKIYYENLWNVVILNILLQELVLNTVNERLV
jgi:hypothetical protein